MNNDVLLIVLTDSSWLYAGLAALMSEMVCRQAGFFAHRLPREETGRDFPAGSRGERIVHQQQDIVLLRLILRGTSQWEEPRREEERVSGYGLTLTERSLLPFYLSGVSLPVLSQLTGKMVKTLYTHRHKILAKTGFRQPAFLQFVYEPNRGLPGIPGLDHTDFKPPTREDEDKDE